MRPIPLLAVIGFALPAAVVVAVLLAVFRAGDGREG
jgi:hypothetical protein